jgi:hypothetical protein
VEIVNWQEAMLIHLFSGPIKSRIPVENLSPPFAGLLGSSCTFMA